MESLNGPDQIIPVKGLFTNVIDGTVEIQTGNGQLESLAPISVPSMLAKVAKRNPHYPALAYKNNVAENGFHHITYREYLHLTRTVAKAFLKLGLKRFHSVAILGYNAPQWFISYLAAIHAGGLATGIYTTNSAEACFYCLKSSQANIVVLEDETQLNKVLQYRRQLPDLKVIVQYTGKPTNYEVISWDELLERGNEEPDTNLNEVLKTMAVNQCCALLYTSGTVGNPKAVMLSHDNITFEIRASLAYMEIEEDQNDRVVSYLPLSHVAAQLIDIFSTLVMAGTVYFAQPDALKGGLIKILQEVEPTRFIGVPRVWEKIVEGMRNAGQQAGPIQTTITTWARGKGVKRHVDLAKGVDSTSVGYRIASALVFSKVKRKLGFECCKSFLSGAAPLSKDVKMYLTSFDIPVMELYGMTECTGAHTINVDKVSMFKLDGVGKPTPGLRVKIDSPDLDGQGEVFLAGRNRFMGYLNQELETEEALKDGWLHTGDLGMIDEDGFLYITGRIKELLITSGGENISPVAIEDNIKRQLPCVGQAVVIGDKRKFLVVLLTLSCDDTGETSQKLSPVCRLWFKNLGFDFQKLSQVIESGPDPKILQALQNGISAANQKAISNAHRIQKFLLLPNDFSPTTGELGPTLKLRRNIINFKYRHEIDNLYEE